MVRQSPSLRPQRRYVWLIGVAALTLYAIVPQLGDFRDSLQLLAHPKPTELIVGVAVLGISYLAAAMTYCLLAFRRLDYADTVRVQLASVFVNRLLPAGVGALGVNFLYLRHAKHKPAEAGAIVAVNNTLGWIGHTTLFVVVLYGLHDHPLKLQLSTPHLGWLKLVLAAVLVLLLASLLVGHWRQRLAKALSQLGSELLRYRRRPLRLIGGLASSMIVTLCTIGSLWFCLLAVGVHLSFLGVFIIFSIALTVGTATPTPGGLGGLEAAMVAGLVAYHVSSSAALAGVLLYRLLSYWLSLAIGALAFISIRQSGLLKH